MKATRDLRRLQRAGLERLDRLREVALRATHVATPHDEAETAVSYCVVELYNCWHSLSRAMFLSAAFRARDGNGARVTLTKPTAHTVDDALTHAITRTKPWLVRRGRKPPWNWLDEPSWSRTAVLLDALDEIGASNRVQVVAAVSLPTAALDHVPKFRHFFAHRNEDTAAQLRPLIATYAIPSSLRATDALKRHASGPGGLRPQPLLLDWVDDVSNVVTMLV